MVSIGLAISKGNLTAPEDSDDDSDTESVTTFANSEEQEGQQPRQRGETEPLLGLQRGNHGRHNLGYHIIHLVIGFLAICLASYVLSSAAANIIDAIGISEVLFGVVILAIATTLPEKFVAVMSGHRGHVGILVANTVGSNIFLLTLCMGIIMIDTSGEFNRGNVGIPELAVLWGSTLAFTLTVWLGARFDRWIGGTMLVGYVAFIVVEFTVNRNVAGTV
ncbi:hypothetical protein ColTof4_06740 [Colletotrichum tofieldiae]|nr:hypothetical protein ColTof3_11681 [Colletotrichum tofieldiae]GKT74317.1 hypothetical protein ColTof4_06740 [Colletotrichum tofieldiae]